MKDKKQIIVSFDFYYNFEDTVTNFDKEIFWKESFTCKQKSMRCKFLQDIHLKYFVIFGASWL